MARNKPLLLVPPQGPTTLERHEQRERQRKAFEKYLELSNELEPDPDSAA